MFIPQSHIQVLTLNTVNVLQVKYKRQYSNCTTDWEMEEPWFDFWQGYVIFSLLQSVWTNSGSLQAICSVGTNGVFSGLKRPDREAEQSPPSNAEVKN